MIDTDGAVGHHDPATDFASIKLDLHNPVFATVAGMIGLFVAIALVFP